MEVMEHQYCVTSSKKKVIKRYRSHKGCSVPECSERACKYSKISLHSFPRNEEMRSKWGESLGMVYIPKNAHSCSNHFSSSDFVISTKGKGMVKRLKKDALPTRQPRPPPEVSEPEQPEPLDKDMEIDLLSSKNLDENENCHPLIPEITLSLESARAEVEKSTQTCEIVMLPQLSPITILDMMRTNQQALAFTGLESINAFRLVSNAFEILEQRSYPSGRRIVATVEKRILYYQIITVSPFQQPHTSEPSELGIANWEVHNKDTRSSGHRCNCTIIG